MANHIRSVDFSFERIVAEVEQGKVHAYFDLGAAFSTGSGVEYDLIEAHKWYNLAAMGGSREGQLCRAEIATEMDREDIAEAQRRARNWIAHLESKNQDLTQVRYAA